MSRLDSKTSVHSVFQLHGVNAPMSEVLRQLRVGDLVVLLRVVAAILGRLRKV